MQMKIKINTPSLFVIFFVLITFFIPMTLLAGGPPKCPCFSKSDINSAIRKSSSYAISDWYTYGIKIEFVIGNGYNNFYADDTRIECWHYWSIPPLHGNGPVKSGNVYHNEALGLTQAEATACQELLEAVPLPQ